jgi:hypothetical protein
MRAGATEMLLAPAVLALQRSCPGICNAYFKSSDTRLCTDQPTNELRQTGSVKCCLVECAHCDPFSLCVAAATGVEVKTQPSERSTNAGATLLVVKSRNTKWPDGTLAMGRTDAADAGPRMTLRHNQRWYHSGNMYVAEAGNVLVGHVQPYPGLTAAGVVLSGCDVLQGGRA